MAYKKVWALGDFHAGEVITGAAQLRKYRALWVGLLMVAPIIVCALFSSLLRAVGVNLGIFETVLNLFVFRWSGVVEYISRWTKGSAIVAKAHVHMTAADAEAYGVVDGEHVSIRMGTDRKLTLNDVIVRVREDFVLAVHIDYDEANAANVSGGHIIGHLIKNR